MFGVHGQYLRIDAMKRTAEVVPIAESTLRAYLGGVGLGAWLLGRETTQGIDPLGPDAALIFAFSPLVGSPLTTSAKFAVVAFSPLTGRISDALSSSHFAIAGKRTGFDALVIKGCCDDLSVILIDGDRATFEPAARLRGLPSREAETRLRDRIGAEWQVSAIGPAGERLIPFASISHDGRHAGRGGLGAVLGSKRIKAVAVKGDRRAPLFDVQATTAIARDLSRRSFGPATEKYRELGTVANLLIFNRFDALPTRNFQAGHFEGVEKLAEEDLAPARRVARNSCAACTIGCEHIYSFGSKREGKSVRLEYESLFSLGPLCGINDPEIVLKAAEACDRHGLDTISTGGTIAFMMECAERGLIDGRLPGSGRILGFGDGVALLEAVDVLLDRRGMLGELLAMGSRRAAETIGGEATGLAPHVKGLELPGYHPAKLPAMALGLAVGTRGADHNRSGAYEADFSERLTTNSSVHEIARAAIETEDRAALIDSLILCKFLRGVFVDIFAESAAMLKAVTGWDVSADELRTVSVRVVETRKALNQREGWTRDEDTLPSRLLGDGTEASSSRPILTRERLDAMITAYYQERGWSADGRVPRLETLTRLDDDQVC